MWSASALKAHCSYPNILGRKAIPTKNGVVAMAKGTEFHRAVEDWAKLGEMPNNVVDPEVRGWLDLLVASGWYPLPGMYFELALGLSPSGTYVPVDELEPHIYTSRTSEPLLTAGRADVAWIEDHGPSRILHLRDWKSGRYAVASPERNLQVTALAMAAADAMKADGYVREIYYARDGYLDADLDPVMLGSAEAGASWLMVQAAALLDDAPHPGEWCGPCWERRKKTCSYAMEVSE